mmetsp:Transcript_17739/g.41721  ORF Transcript_17739/g.41721 Transcript_17739/m.41721 type:complete len:200 (+) Transcript_17739:132-731(+)
MVPENEKVRSVWAAFCPAISEACLITLRIAFLLAVLCRAAAGRGALELPTNGSSWTVSLTMCSRMSWLTSSQVGVWKMGFSLFTLAWFSSLMIRSICVCLGSIAAKSRSISLYTMVIREAEICSMSNLSTAYRSCRIVLTVLSLGMYLTRRRSSFTFFTAIGKLARRPPSLGGGRSVIPRRRTKWCNIPSTNSTCALAS